MPDSDPKKPAPSGPPRLRAPASIQWSARPSASPPSSGGPFSTDGWPPEGASGPATVSAPAPAEEPDEIEDDEPVEESGPASVRIAVPVQANRISGIPPADEKPAPILPQVPKDVPAFTPPAPRTWEEVGLDPGFAEQLILRFMMTIASDTHRNIASAVCLPLTLVKEILEQLKLQKLVNHKGATKMGDFISELSEAGRAKAMEARKLTTYVGPAPVPWDQYLLGVAQQSLSVRSPGPEDLQRAFEDLQASEDLLERLGPAITSGRAMFLFGAPGNGKTSLAERITKCFGDDIWIPHALYVDGNIVKLFDPATHEEQPIPDARDGKQAEKLDRRWVRIRRPTVITGGELTLEMLEMQENEHAHLCEAPLQLKANCGTLVIDDFGRQRVPPQELLNRWIFPLERRIDFLRLPDGRKLSVPFDALLVFSTNLEPRDLADEAFLRRIPYKINVMDPTEDEFRSLVELTAQKMRVTLPRGSVNYLVERHYKLTKRPMRFCHPRDLLSQIVHIASYERKAAVAGPPEWDKVVANYFGMV